MPYREEYKDCLDYIDTYWEQVIFKPTKKVINRHVITIPHPFITPNPAWLKKFSYVFYWDTFFMFRGLIRTNREWVLKNMVDNFVYLFETYGVIPNFNSPASMGRSQPPFFTSMILDTYNGYYYQHMGKNKFLKPFASKAQETTWLRKVTNVAKKEYGHVWLDPEGLYNHSVKGYTLSRYGDRDIGYAHSSELESGWDFTSRFYNRCDEFLPIDLNVLLFKYERDFAKIAYHLGDLEEEKHWKKIANERKKEINKLLWDEENGFFYDYDYQNKRMSSFLSLAGFTPLWAGLASREQAEKMVKKLPIFETDYGLTITAKDSLAPKIDMRRIPELYRPAIEDITNPKQWDYPNSWPPLEYLTTIGLLKYGFIDSATRLMKKYLTTHAAAYRKYGTFMEKINGVTGQKASNFTYETQSGFGWTNAIFYRYVHILDSLENSETIYVEPKPTDPPFKLAIPH